MNNKCIYYIEGPCEQQLIAALKEAPERLIPGKIKVFNVVQNLIPKSQMSENHFFPQVLNLEDELVRCTDVRTAMELTKSGSVKNFTGNSGVFCVALFCRIFAANSSNSFSSC